MTKGKPEVKIGTTGKRELHADERKDVGRGFGVRSERRWTKLEMVCRYATHI